MNFQDLLIKIKQLDEIAPAALGNMAAQAMAKKAKAGPGLTPSSPADNPDNPWQLPEPTKESGDMLASECGGMMSPMSSPKQSDSVTMNVSMNGSGAGGIKDLIGILRNIENGDSGKDSKDVLVGLDATETFANEPNTSVAGIDAAHPKGDDISSHGGNEVDAVAGGGNPYTNVDESLVSRLADLYNEVKSR